MTAPTVTIDWRSIGAKRRGRAGWAFRSPRRGPFWLISVGEIVWPGERFWRVGLCDHTRGDLPVEVAHLRFPTEADAFEGVQWLLVVASSPS